MLRYLLLVYQAIPNCHEPLTFDTLPSKPLFGYVTALLSPLIALLVAGEVEDFSMVDKINQFEDIDLITRRHSLICCESVPDLYESKNRYK